LKSLLNYLHTAIAQLFLGVCRKKLKIMKTLKSMKKLLAISLSLAWFANIANAGFFGGYGFGLILDVNGTTTNLYDVSGAGTDLLPTGSTATYNGSSWANGSGSAPVLNLGTFNPLTGDKIILQGGSALVYADVGSGGYASGGYLNFRVFPGTGTVAQAAAPGFPGGTAMPVVAYLSGNNYRVDVTNMNVNIIAGLTPGIYTLDANAFILGHSDAANGASDFINNSGANYGAYFTIAGGCPTIQMAKLVASVKNVATSQNLNAYGGIAPYTYTKNSGSLPPGLSLSTAGVLSGIPSATGQYTFTVLATDNNGCTGTNNYALQIYGSGADNASDYSSWTNRANAGSGFANWELYSDIHGGSTGNTYAGFEKQNSSGSNIQSPDGSVWKLYAKGFGSTPWEEAEGYRKFNVPLSAAGDQFVLSFQNGLLVGHPGQVGFALRNGDYSGSGGFNGRARLQIYFNGGDTNLTVQDASGAQQIAGLGFTTYGWDVVVTLTGPNTYSASITRYSGLGTADAPVIVTGTLSGSGPIDSLAMFNWNYDITTGENDDAYFNNLGYTSTTTVITNDVTFNVDMSVQILAGNFNPASQTVEVHGTFSDWLGVTLTNNPSLPGNAANVYSGVVPIRGALNSGESYWFDYYDNASFTKESETPKVSTLDSGPTHYDRFLLLPNVAATNLPVVLFSDLNTNDYLPAATAVTFSVNMNGAVTTAGYVFGTSPSDTVWINGAFIPWYPWYTPADPSGTAGPAQYQMFESATPGVYTNTIIIPVGGGLVVNYKYGIGIGTNSPADGGPRDNEAAVNLNHNRVIRSTATGAYVLPLDKFGNQYVEPFFSVQAKADGQLQVGAPVGGAVPVTWLGRPGAHLQDTTNLTGSWTDYPNTDGAHWTSGVNTTNGLLSVTNMPATGNNYFRLVKP